MHILHVETGRQLHGGARQVLVLMAGLDRLGVRSTLACARGSAIAEAAGRAGHTVATLDFAGDLDPRLPHALFRLVARGGLDLLHAHSRRGADFYGGLAARGRVPAVLTRRVDNRDTPLVGRLKYRRYRRVIAISRAVYERLQAEGVPSECLRLIPSAVEETPAHPGWPRERFRSTFALAPRELSVAVVAQLIPRKGHHVVLDAWPAIRERVPAARLLVFGAGPLERALKDRAAGDSSITFAGFRPELREFVGHVDLVVHAASLEGLGVGLLEAQAAGVPVVACAAGGVPEAVVDGVTGYLVPPGDGAALAAAALRLLDDAPLRKQFGEAGRARMQREFSPSLMAEAYLDLYRELVPRRTDR